MIKFRTYTHEETQDANFHPCRACKCSTKVDVSTTRCMEANECGGGYYTDDIPVKSKDRKALESLLGCLKVWPDGAEGFASCLYTDGPHGIVQGLTPQEFSYLVTVKETMENEKKVLNESVDCSGG